MKITKLGHCCLIIEENGKKVMTDPGFFTVDAHTKITGLDLIVFTHEHGDHYHLDSLKIVIEKNPQAKIVTNTAVGKLLDPEKIVYEILEHGQQKTISDIKLEGFGNEHAEIYDALVPRVQNTGFMFADRLFYPGDSLYVPEKQAEILALPTAGPWVKIKESIDYAKTVNPKKCFPVHDDVIKDQALAFFNGQPQKALKMVGIEMLLPNLGEAMDF